MKAIIIAAGSGKRFNSKGKELPKSMIPVNKKPIIEYQISSLNQVGIDEIHIITGPYSDKFNLKNVNYIKDLNFLEHDILGSLMEAKNYLNSDVVILYSDILFEKEIITEILESQSDISIAVDMNWEKMYDGRTQHPKNEAENVQIENKKIVKIKKNLTNSNKDVGEFLGILKLTTKGCKILVEIHNELINYHKTKFHEAPSISKAYITDMIQELIDRDVRVEPILITGKWCEIDTEEDLIKAEKIFK